MALRFESFQVPHPAGGSIFEIPSLFVRKGERIALLGRNGTGKSVFLRAIVAGYEAQRLGGSPPTGLHINPQYVLGYYDQHLTQLDGELTPVELVRAVTNLPTQEIRRVLARAGFALDEQERTSRQLSGGERARLQFLLLSLQRASLLLFDEPTNHLDIEGRESLESELLSGEATLLFVSHDRRFVSNVANRFLLLENGRLRELASVADWCFAEPAPHSNTPASADTRTASSTSSADQLLQRIVELEEKLKADRRQKAARQSLSRQSQWEAELARLYAALAAYE
jgi:ATPase subunit of ABC transporter with duplicated ATPase domains